MPLSRSRNGGSSPMVEAGHRSGDDLAQPVEGVDGMTQHRDMPVLGEETQLGVWAASREPGAVRRRHDPVPRSVEEKRGGDHVLHGESPWAHVGEVVVDRSSRPLFQGRAHNLVQPRPLPRQGREVGGRELGVVLLTSALESLLLVSSGDGGSQGPHPGSRHPPEPVEVVGVDRCETGAGHRRHDPVGVDGRARQGVRPATGVSHDRISVDP